MPDVQDEVPTWFEEDFVLPQRTSQLGGPVSGQITHIMPRISIKAYRLAYQKDDPLHKFILLDLKETVVSPGPLAADQDDKRGAFTDRVEVWAGFASEKAFLVKNSFPDTTAEGGSVSKSVSYDLGGGWMGHTPMFNANWTVSAGVTQAIPDFEIRNNVAGSGGATLDHTYQLALIGGGKYQHPIDAVDTTGVKGSIRSLPPKACADFRLVSSALFYTPEPLSSCERLILSIVHRVMFVEKTLKPLAGVLPDYDPSRDNEQQCSRLAGCWFGTLQVDTTPFLNAQKWLFDVNLDDNHGSVTQVQHS